MQHHGHVLFVNFQPWTAGNMEYWRVDDCVFGLYSQTVDHGRTFHWYVLFRSILMKKILVFTAYLVPPCSLETSSSASLQNLSPWRWQTQGFSSSCIQNWLFYLRRSKSNLIHWSQERRVINTLLVDPSSIQVSAVHTLFFQIASCLELILLILSFRLSNKFS